MKHFNLGQDRTGGGVPESDNSCSLDVLIVYEDLGTGLRAKLLFDRILGRLGGETDLHVHLSNLSLLDDSSEQIPLDSIARQAGILVVSLGDEGEQCGRAKEWFKKQIRQGRLSAGALVLLIESHHNLGGISHPLADEFERLAHSAGIDFFFRSSPAPLIPHYSREQISERAHCSSTTLQRILHQEETPSSIRFPLSDPFGTEQTRPD